MTLLANLGDVISQEMGRESERLEKDIAEMERTLHAAKEVRNDAYYNKALSTDSAWTDSYRQWERYEDIEELEDKIKSAKKDLNKLKEKKENPSKKCSHRFKCSCSCDKQAEQEVVGMGTLQRLKHMQLFREQGNFLFRKKKYEEALGLYEKSLIYFEYCFDGTDDECQQADDLRLKCLLNSAACFLHLKMFSRCVDYCSEALEIDDQNAKAWFRRAQAHRLKGNFCMAEKDLSKVIEVNGGIECRGIRQEMQLLREKKEVYEKASKEFAQRAIAMVSKESNDVITKVQAK